MPITVRRPEFITEEEIEMRSRFRLFAQISCAIFICVRVIDYTDVSKFSGAAWKDYRTSYGLQWSGRIGRFGDSY